LQQAVTSPAALENYLRTRTVERNEGVIGRFGKMAWRRYVGFRRRTGAGEVAQFSLWHCVGDDNSASLRQTNMGVLALGQARRARLSPQATSLFSKSIAEHRRSRFTRHIYSEANEKKRSTTICKSRANSARALPSVAPSFDGSKSTPEYSCESGQRPITLIISKWIDERLGVVIADVSGKAFRHRSSWRFAAVFCAAPRRGILRPPMFCRK